MRNSLRALILAGLVAAVGCSDDATAPTTTATPGSQPSVAKDITGRPPPENVGTMGVIDDLKPQEQGLVLYQLGFDYEPPPGAKFDKVEHKLAVGARHAKLQVHVIKDSTRIILGGVDTTFDALKVGDQVLVVGRVTGASVHADAIISLAEVAAPPEDMTGVLPPGVRTELVSHPGAELRSSDPPTPDHRPTTSDHGTARQSRDPSPMQFDPRPPTPDRRPATTGPPVKAAIHPQCSSAPDPRPAQRLYRNPK